MRFASVCCQLALYAGHRLASRACADVVGKRCVSVLVWLPMLPKLTESTARLWFLREIWELKVLWCLRQAR